MRDGRGAGEGQLEGGLEEEAAEDHEVVAVAVLGLHDLDRVHLGLLHEGGGGGLPGWRGGVVPVELEEPEGVDEIGFRVVGGLLLEG